MKRPAVHPAQYTPKLIDPIVSLLRGKVPKRGVLGDPMAGLGWRLAQIAARLDMDPDGVEIESGYFSPRRHAHSCVRQGDSTQPIGVDIWHGMVVSPAYPNGVSDCHNATDESVRNTYAHRLRAHVGAGYRMHPNNSGAMSPRRSPSAYAEFMAVHAAVWASTFTAVAPGSYGVVNVKDTKLYEFTADTVTQLRAAGFHATPAVEVRTPGNRDGANRDVRADAETLILALRPV